MSRPRSGSNVFSVVASAAVVAVVGATAMWYRKRHGKKIDDETTLAKRHRQFQQQPLERVLDDLADMCRDLLVFGDYFFEKGL